MQITVVALLPKLTYSSDLRSFKCELSELRCELSTIYLPQVGTSDELTYFLTYLYLFGNKCAKYQLSKILVFLKPRAPKKSPFPYVMGPDPSCETVKNV